MQWTASAEAPQGGRALLTYRRLKEAWGFTLQPPSGCTGHASVSPPRLSTAFWRPDIGAADSAFKADSSWPPPAPVGAIHASWSLLQRKAEHHGMDVATVCCAQITVLPSASGQFQPTRLHRGTLGPCRCPCFSGRLGCRCLRDSDKTTTSSCPVPRRSKPRGGQETRAFAPQHSRLTTPAVDGTQQAAVTG